MGARSILLEARRLQRVIQDLLEVLAVDQQFLLSMTQKMGFEVHRSAVWF